MIGMIAWSKKHTYALILSGVFPAPATVDKPHNKALHRSGQLKPPLISTR